MVFESGFPDPQLNLNFFELLNLPVRYFIDSQELQKNYYDFSRLLHPDKFQNKAASELELATYWFSRVNEAFETLRSGFLRARYILELAQLPALKEDKAMPLSLSEKYFDLQEVLEERGDAAAYSSLPQFRNFLALIDEEIRKYENEIIEAFKRWESEGARLDGETAPLKEVARLSTQKTYLTSMKRDLEKKCQM